MQNARSFNRFGLLMTLCVVATVLSGCGPKGGDKGLTGKVSLNGKPVTGNVIFIGADKKEQLALLNNDGKYSFTDLPAGEYKIVVRGLSTGPVGKRPGAPKLAAPAVAESSGAGEQPPAKYADAATSGLTYSYPGGKQTYNIELTP